MKNTWREKLEDKGSLPGVLKLEKRFPCYNAVHKMGAEAGDEVVLVNPSEVVDIMKQISEGKLTTIVNICMKLARRHGTKGCCSLTTGIFIMTAANATEEARQEGKVLDIPYWRTLKADGYLNPKYPGGQEAHRELLEREGHEVVQKGRKYLVKDFQKHLTSPRDVV
jgi:alkylated DNA nucleotide flippase Atl1